MQSNSIVSRRFAFTRLNSPCARSAAKSSHPAAHHSVVRSSGMSPDLRVALASPKSPVAGSPERLKATAPTMPGLRGKRFGLHHGRVRIEAFDRLASGGAVGGHEGQGDGRSPRSSQSSLPCFAHPTARDPPRRCCPAGHSGPSSVVATAQRQKSSSSSSCRHFRSLWAVGLGSAFLKRARSTKTILSVLPLVFDHSTQERPSHRCQTSRRGRGC
jgi:hypothetical protein